MTPHDSILVQQLVKPHRRKLVTEKPKLSGALDGFGTASGAELRIDVTNVGVHSVHGDVRLQVPSPGFHRSSRSGDDGSPALERH